VGHQVLGVNGSVDYSAKKKAEEEMIEGEDQRQAPTQSKPQRSSRQLNVSELEGAATLEALLLASMARKVEKDTRAPHSLKVQALACTQHIKTQRK